MAKQHEVDKMSLSLKGQFLIAMPEMDDDRFKESVVYLVGHSDEGAMGLMINQPLTDMQFADILEEMQLGKPEELINLPSGVRDRAVMLGGPVERGRGFVLHTPDYFGQDNTYSVNSDVCLTATIDILRAISFGPEPEHSLLALGYCGWAPGQLEDEIKANGWLTAPHSSALLFDVPVEDRYSAALKTLGITMASLSSQSGHA